MGGGGGGNDEDIEGETPKIFRHPKGGLRKCVHFKTNRAGGGGGSLKIELLEGGLLKFQASSSISSFPTDFDQIAVPF